MRNKGQDARPGQITAADLLKLPCYFWRGVKYHTAGRVHTPRPLYATLRVTRSCNSRCVMCSDWKRRDQATELTAAQLGEMLSNPLFRSLEKFVLGGGEPTLRGDLADIARTTLESCPNLKAMSLLTNGLEPDTVVERVRQLLALPQLDRLETFAVSVSLDGHGETCDRIRRVPQAFERVSETISRLKELKTQRPFYLCSTCVVQPLNIDNLVQLYDHVKGIGLPIVFSPVCVSNIFVEDEKTRESLKLTTEQLQKLKGLLGNELSHCLMPSNVPFWREYFAIVEGRKRRKLPCCLCHYGAGIDSDGTLLLCSADSSLVYGSMLDTPPDELWYSDEAKELRRRAERLYCPSCTICCDLAFCFRLEFFYYATFLIKEKAIAAVAGQGAQ